MQLYTHTFQRHTWWQTLRGGKARGTFSKENVQSSPPQTALQPCPWPNPISAIKVKYIIYHYKILYPFHTGQMNLKYVFPKINKNKQLDKKTT